MSSIERVQKAVIDRILAIEKHQPRLHQAFKRRMKDPATSIADVVLYYYDESEINNDKVLIAALDLAIELFKRFNAGDLYDTNHKDSARPSRVSTEEQSTSSGEEGDQE